MLPGLFDDERAALRRLAAMLVAGALALLPLTSQRSLDAGAAAAEDSAATPSAPPRLSRMTFPGFDVERDPFVPARVQSQAAFRATGPPAAPALVRAIVTGSPTRALLETGGTVRIVAPGDRIGERTILDILPAGIVLSDGTHLPIVASTP